MALQKLKISSDFAARNVTSQKVGAFFFSSSYLFFPDRDLFQSTVRAPGEGRKKDRFEWVATTSTSGEHRARAKTKNAGGSEHMKKSPGSKGGPDLQAKD